LFQGRFKGILVQKEAYLLEVSRYVVLNPVRAGMVRQPEDWRWSSYRATVGLEVSAPFLCTDWLLGAFGEERRNAVDAYREFVAEGVRAGCPWDQLKQQVYLGSTAFVEEMRALIDPDRPLQEVPRPQHPRSRGQVFLFAPPPVVLLNILAQSSVDPRLILPGLRFEPRDQVSIDPKSDLLLDRPIESASNGAGEILDFGNVFGVDLVVRQLS
jgi:hypothetical protein